MSKYRNKPHNGYHSKREANIGAELEALEKAGKISGLVRQCRYMLIKSQKGNIRNERPVAYIADFVYWDHGGIMHVVDAKGFKTPDYVIKRKLMKMMHGIEIEEM